MAGLVPGLDIDTVIQLSRTLNDVGAFGQLFQGLDHKPLQTEHRQGAKHQKADAQRQNDRIDRTHDLVVDFSD